MWITIIADASYCPKTQKAGYGFWIASQRGKLGGEGVMAEEPVNNVAAEMMAMLIALHTAQEKKLLMECDAVLLQTDCYPAIDAFTGTRRNVTEQEAKLMSLYAELVRNMRIHIRLKHVKGHSEEIGARFESNRICDMRARRAMRKARDQHRDMMIREFLNDC